MAVEVTFPRVDMDMTSGRVLAWLVEEGQSVRKGEPLFEIETDKAAMEIEAPATGVLRGVSAAKGVEVDVGRAIGWIVADGEAWDGGGSAIPDSAPEPAAASHKNEDVTEIAPSVEAAGHDKTVRATPLARRMAKEGGIDLSSLRGSGPNGRILRADVEAVETAGRDRPAAKEDVAAARVVAQPAAPVAANPAPAPAPLLEGGMREEKNSSMRRAIARRLAESVRERPHFYVTMDVELGELNRLRSALNRKSPPDGKQGAFKISVNDMLVKAAALALKRVPGVAVTFTEDAILHHERIDISVAVAVPDGLITPILRDADRKGLAALSNESKALFARARDGKLKPEEFQGGCFSISNLGMLGVREFTAIINPPQSAILAVGAGEQRAVVRDGELAIAEMMTVTLSSDHRAIDGALAARFLGMFRQIVEDPMELML